MGSEWGVKYGRVRVKLDWKSSEISLRLVKLSRQDETVVIHTASCKKDNFTDRRAYFTIRRIISRGVPHFTATARG